MDDTLADELFVIKAKFMREIPHPKLILKAIELLQKGMMHFSKIDLEVIGFGTDDLKTALINHSNTILSIKLKISQSDSEEKLLNALIELYKLQVTLISNLATYLPLRENYPDTQIKISEPIETYVIYQFIQSTGLNENEIKAYICNSITNKLEAEFDVLTIACLRSRKISEHARSI